MTTSTAFPLDDTTLGLLAGVTQTGPVSMVRRHDGWVSRGERLPDVQRELAERLHVLGVDEWTPKDVIVALVAEVRRLRADLELAVEDAAHCRERLAELVQVGDGVVMSRGEVPAFDLVDPAG